jgi:hypothetical protein
VQRDGFQMEGAFEYLVDYDAAAASTASLL